jgi:ATP-binding cassette, subfamily A (ABC1), member 3
MESLPGGIQSFNVTGFENTRPYLARDMNESLFEFDDELQRTASSSGPYRYGSYYVLESNNRTKQFKVASFLNLTS